MHMRHLLASLIALVSPLLAQAQTVTETPSGIKFTTVAEALASLEALDGNGTVVTHPEGWVVINEHQAGAQWSFVPKAHPAYPAVIRRVILRKPGQPVAVQTATICEASKEACTKLLEEFAAMNERITQSVRARARQGSSAAQPE